MKILILGHKGMLGSDLMLRLFPFHDLVGKDVDDFDITAEDDCRKLVGEHSPDVVINAAAFTNVDGCETDHQKCMAVNALGVKHMALACRGRRIVLVHFSTDYVFDGRRDTPYNEEDQPAPLNVYGNSKLEGERFLQAFSERWLLIRTAWLYGRHGNNFVKAILEKADKVGSLEVVNDQVGSPTWSWDLTAAVQLLIEGGHTGVFHVTSRGRCSWYDFACKILQYAGKKDVLVRPIHSDQLSRPAKRPTWSVLSTKKFTETTGRTMRFWQIALQEYLEKTGCQKQG